jgi:hypothetical protein
MLAENRIFAPAILFVRKYPFFQEAFLEGQYTAFCVGHNLLYKVNSTAFAK